MIFNGHSDNQDIVSHVADATGVNSTADIGKITRAVNTANRKILSIIHEAYGGWQYDDSNNSDLPTATADLVSSQGKYTIPDTALTIRQISVKDESGFWRDIEPITLEDIHSVSNEDEFNDTAGNPRYYRMVSNVIELYPAPNYSQTRSLRCFFDRGAATFATTDTTKTPGFASEFHDAVHVGASAIIAADRSLKNYQLKTQQWQEWLNHISEYYKSRFVELSNNEVAAYLEDPLTNLH